MDTLREWLARIIAFIRTRDRDEDFNAELSAHLELSIQEHLRHGLSPDEARRRALIGLGGMEQARELHREHRGLPVVDSLLQDVCCSCRATRREPTSALAVVVTLSLGIGACTALFSLYDSLLLRPLPVRDPASLAALHDTVRNSYWSGDAPGVARRAVPLLYRRSEPQRRHLLGERERDWGPVARCRLAQYQAELAWPFHAGVSSGRWSVPDARRRDTGHG